MKNVKLTPLSLVEDIANFTLKEGSNTIKDLVTKHSLCLRPQSSISNAPPITAIRLKTFNHKHDGLYVFSEIEKKEISKLKIRKKIFEGSIPLPDDMVIYTPKDADFEYTYSAIMLYKKKTHDFLKICREEKALPELFIQEIFYDVNPYFKPMLSINKFAPIITSYAFAEYFEYIEDELAQKIFLQPLFQGYGENFIKNRFCEECGNLYFYKLEKAKFCSNACKMRNVRKNK